MPSIEDDELYRTLGRIEGKLDHVLKNYSKTQEKVGAHGKRIDHLEQSRSYFRGGIAVLSVILAYLAAQLNIPLPF